VVKSGDIVKVKVLEVEVARKRIALTLRLDDESGGRSERSAQTKSGNSARGAATASPRKQQEPSGGGALAEALRRASEKNAGR
jgi:protein Tex